MEIPEIVCVLAVFYRIVLLFAALKLFTIASTLKEILAEMRKDSGEVPYSRANAPERIITSGWPTLPTVPTTP